MLRIWSGLRRQQAPLIILEDEPSEKTPVAAIVDANPLPPQKASSSRRPPTPPDTTQPTTAERPTTEVILDGIRISVPLGVSRYRVRMGARKYAL